MWVGGVVISSALIRSTVVSVISFFDGPPIDLFESSHFRFPRLAGTPGNGNGTSTETERVPSCAKDRVAANAPKDATRR
jgi:hypothetical protein